MRKTRSKLKPKKRARLSGSWPTERDVLFRPERLQYVKKKKSVSGDCVFCAIREQGVGLESLMVHEEKHSMVLLNKFPYNPGHCLILPKRHISELTQLSLEEAQEFILLLQKATGILSESYQPSALNIGMNQGADAGAGIPQHLHFHVVPRWSGDTNFFPLIAGTKVTVETLEQTFERLLPFFK